MEFVPGQRWISHSETQLGLGIVTEVSGRRVKIIYPAVGESRIYASDEAPLSRIQYNPGEKIFDNADNAFVVNDVQFEDGLLVYQTRDAEGVSKTIHELDLSCFVQFTTPQQRLFSGQLDKNKNFALRVETLLQTHRLQKSPVKGLLGSRTDLLAHQIYIASHVAKRHAPRVLLADEVGLGKTIEAGMILHYQLFTGQAKRILILVPDSLVHQWLVEMLRRFNLSFSVYDQERITSLLAENNSNPFEAEQQILCSLSVLTESQENQHYMQTAHWDMVIVDEAHHLVWHEQKASKEYQCVERLAQSTQSLLLLTATPEQVGVDSHFARLRLLDPARFHDLQIFKQEQAGYEALNTLVQALLNDDELNEPQQKLLTEYLGNDVVTDKDEIIAKLLDRHGTGRVLFRNTRNAVQGFPQRCPLPYPLDKSDTYSSELTAIYPEQGLEDEFWLQHDPRVSWLVDHLKNLKPNKVLVICHHANTAIALDNYLNLRMGVRSTSFYEGLSIIERDRAAAYFADGANPDELDNTEGAQVLICSEIGSEGRNFQFAHHLVLFDLPINPDLLEQRIGRLDRIRQNHDVQIHIPYIKDTAQEVIFRWLHEGVDLFSQSCSAGFEIYNHFAKQLDSMIQSCVNLNEGEFKQFIDDTHQFTQQIMQSLHDGRDRLLELNSCNHEQAEKLIEQIGAEDQPEELRHYMELVFDQFGVESDFHSEHSYVISPGDHMHGNFPGLREEGNTITYQRKKALAREDMEFVSWEHPMVSESMEMIINSEFGNTAVAVVSIEGLPKGTLLVETWYSLNVIANKQLQLERYLPINPIRFLLDNNSKNYSKALSYSKLGPLCQSLPKKTALAIVEKTRPMVESLLNKTQILADQELDAIKSNAMQGMQQNLGTELERLQALQQVNPSIREDEINFIRECIDLSTEQINRAAFQLQAVRLIINN